MGEWSLAITDCTLWLNGRGVGARWDNTYYPQPGTQALGSCAGLSMDSSKFSADYKTFLRKCDPVMMPLSAVYSCNTTGTGRRKYTWARCRKGGYSGRGKQVR